MLEFLLACVKSPNLHNSMSYYLGITIIPYFCYSEEDNEARTLFLLHPLFTPTPKEACSGLKLNQILYFSLVDSSVMVCLIIYSGGVEKTKKQADKRPV